MRNSLCTFFSFLFKWRNQLGLWGRRQLSATQAHLHCHPARLSQPGLYLCPACGLAVMDGRTDGRVLQHLAGCSGECSVVTTAALTTALSEAKERDSASLGAAVRTDSQVVSFWARRGLVTWLLAWERDLAFPQTNSTSP